MSARSLVRRLRHPQTTVRWRLTLMYGGLFLVCGAVLLAVTYALLANATVTSTRSLPIFANARTGTRGPPPPNPTAVKAHFGAIASGNWTTRPTTAHFRRPVQANVPGLLKHLLGSQVGRQALATVGTQQRISDLNKLEVQSAIALAIMAIISGALGWVVAGRVLRPLRTITAATQLISEANLHERLALDGPRDELRLLADTIDGLLERLQAAFDAQRRFVANASHELRTPLTATRALLEMVMSDPDANVDTFREVCGHVLEEGEQQERLISALLALARGQRGVDRRQRIDLATIAGGVVHAQELNAVANGLRLEVSLDAAPISGDPKLVERLVSNLLENAIRHNAPNGTVRVHVAASDASATLSISNTGPVVPAGEVVRLLQPFQRLGADRVAHQDGLGLGLSIVAAIANAHNATLDVRSRAAGGLDIDVRFPRAHAADPGPTSAPAGQPEPAPVVV